MKMTNLEIYTIASHLMEAFHDNEQKFPVKMNFFLQKNKRTLLTFAQEIEEARMTIAQTYGIDSGDGNFSIASENVSKAQEELNQLFSIEQDVNIVKISYNDLDPNMELTSAQMDALMFMIE
jgi:hypothetical protein